MSNILPDTPIKCSHDFMRFGRAKLSDRYDEIKSGMTSTAGLVFYASPDIPFSAMDVIKEAITQAVTDKDGVTERKKIRALKVAMRGNIPFVEKNCGNDLATMLISGYKEAQQGGGPKAAIGGTLHFSADDTGIAGEIKGKYTKPKGAKYVEGYSKLHTAPDSAYALTQVTDLEEIVWEGVVKGVENDYKVRSGAGRRKGAFSAVITAICRY